jgi:hypothetical protein
MTLILNKRENAAQVNPAPREPVFRLDEAVAVCPKCKAVETVCFIANKLTQTRKYTQRDGQIFHDCGSTLPCKLYKGV